MNPDRIYREHRDDALARQVTAHEYTTFVAMPFGDRFSYRSRDVFDWAICAAAACATERDEAARPFARPIRADDRAGVAGVITEDIIVDILETHFFVADLTFANPGVLLEAGAALGLKPNGQIILLLQGDPRDLHFDIRNNRVIRYDSDGAVEEIASALIAAARAFEDDRQRYVESVTRSLSPDAILYLNGYAILQKDSPGQGGSPANLQIGGNLTIGSIRYYDALRELTQRRLLRIDYAPPPSATPALRLAELYFVSHATELAWAVIEHMWPALRR
jgi:hypothetical protein